MHGQQSPKTHKGHIAILLGGIILFVIFAGCASSPSQDRTSPVPVPAPSQSGSCADKPCFITAANDCGSLEITMQEDIGTFRYSSSPSFSQNCTFTKTLVSLNSSESQAMKNMLEGKNMTCRYTKGKFDQRLVTTLTGGMEYCRGDLKDNLGRLMIFT